MGIFLKLICILVLLLCGGGLLQGLYKSTHRIKKVFGTMASGLIALTAVHFIGVFIGVALPISLLSLSTASVLGIPGVILQLCLNVIW